MVTRDDVARHAGVSVAVVSYVVNNKDNVKEATRQKVLQAIDELGYKPNLTARSLKTKKTGQIGVLFDNLGNPFETGISLGLEEQAREMGYSLIFQTLVHAEEEKLKTVFMGRTDGLLLLGQSLGKDTVEHFTKLDVPFYSVMTPAVRLPAISAIDINWHEAMLQLLSHLKGLGHVRIGFMGHMDDEHYLHIRYRHFLQAMEQLDLHFDAAMLLLAEGRLEPAYAVMSQLLGTSRDLPFTAIICANDLMGIGVLSAAKDAGVSVPEQLSVACCEDIMMASHTTPALTTLHYPRQKAGYMAIQLLLEQIDSPQKPRHVEPKDTIIDFELVLRQSTGAAPQ